MDNFNLFESDPVVAAALEGELARERETIDCDEVERLARERRPKLIVGGASAYPRIIDFERMAAIAHEVGARFMVDMAHIAGLVATGAHPSPVPHADVVTSTSHKTLRALARSRRAKGAVAAMPRTLLNRSRAFGGRRPYTGGAR